MKFPVRRVSLSNSVCSQGARDETQESEIVSLESQVKDPRLTSEIELAVGTTENMQDYCSVKVHVGIKIACENTPIARRAAVQQASDEMHYYLKAEMQKGRDRFEEFRAQAAQQTEY